MSECCISSNHSDSKCFTANSNNYSQWSDGFLCRWKCNLNLKCRVNLFMVKWSDHCKFKHYHSRKLHCSGDQCKWMSECCLFSNHSKCKCLAVSRCRS